MSASEFGTLERLFNVREGKGREDDFSTRRLLEEPISTGPARGEGLSKDQFELMLTEYYELRGWDKTTGFPTQEKLSELGVKEG